MAQAVINYDLNLKHSEVKREMQARGYHDSYVDSGVTYNLPNTTLWKPNTELATAMADIKAAAAKCGATLERAIALSLDNRNAIPGKAH